MADRREELLEAATAVVRQGGYPALTQPKVAAVAGMTQSHLTYYFPTRADLVHAVAERIVRNQLASFDAQPVPRSREAAVENIVALVTATERTRAFMTLLLAADEEPAAQDAFVELVAGMRLRGTRLLAGLSGETGDQESVSAHEADGRLLHAASVGAAVLSLAEGDGADDRATARMLARLLDVLAPAPWSRSRSTTTAPEAREERSDP